MDNLKIDNEIYKMSENRPPVCLHSKAKKVRHGEIFLPLKKCNDENFGNPDP